MGLFKKKMIINYQKEEITRLEKNLKKLSEGELDFDMGVSEGNQYVSTEKDQFFRINRYLLQVKESMNHLSEDTENMEKNIKEGNIEYRLDTSKYKGVYSRIGMNINEYFEMISKPLNELILVLEAVSVNDFTNCMNRNYKGSFAEISDKMKNVVDKLLILQNYASQVANGDISALTDLKKIGKRSENDQMIPAFIEMMGTIQALIYETETLSQEAENGNLSARGNAGKFKGEYSNIIIGINGMLDAVVKPIKEVTEVMSHVGEGNLSVSVKGNYKGDYVILVNAVNTTLDILNHVVEKIGNILSEVAKGNLNISNVSEFKGDFSIISRSLNKIINDLNNTMKDINTAAEQVAAGSGLISNTSQNLSQGSEEQASSIEEVTSSITEMATQVKQNAANAKQANSLSLIAKEDAIKGDEQMKEMLQAMHDINESSSNISKIIKVIDDIAFQTNILALNAAVEAARAGQYGKGFAVVAEEVRNLAQKSAGAAKETTTMIEGSIEKVTSGTTIANNTAQALKEIVGSITKATDLVGEIASASSEQASAISQINQAIEQVSQVIQTNSATAEEGASASEELTSQAEMLKEMVNNFKLKETKDIKPMNLNKLNPEIVRAIEEMIEKNNYSEEKAQKGKIDIQVEKTNNIVNSKPQIILDDQEFGKY